MLTLANRVIWFINEKKVWREISIKEARNVEAEGEVEVEVVK